MFKFIVHYSCFTVKYSLSLFSHYPFSPSLTVTLVLALVPVLVLVLVLALVIVTFPKKETFCPRLALDLDPRSHLET